MHKALLFPLILLVSSPTLADSNPDTIGVRIQVPKPKLVIGADLGELRMTEIDGRRHGVRAGLFFAERLYLGLEYARIDWGGNPENYLGGGASLTLHKGGVSPFLFAATGVSRASRYGGHEDLGSGRVGLGLTIGLSRRVRLHTDAHLGARKILRRTEPPTILSEGGALLYRPSIEGLYRGWNAGVSLLF